MKSVKELIAKLETQGWRSAGQTRAGHHRLVHESGARMQVSTSPSDRRTRLNELARARRAVTKASERKAK